MACLYDFLAPAYDPAFLAIFHPYRVRAFDLLPPRRYALALDLACGTGQNFPLLKERLGPTGTLLGVDISSGMLHRARRRAASLGANSVHLLQLDAAQLTPTLLEGQTGARAVDLVVCTYGFTSMRAWEKAFAAAWALLVPGGVFLVLDIDGSRRNWHTRAVEIATCSSFSRPIGPALRTVCADFQMDYLDPSAHLFGGRLFVAYGTKAPATTPAPCPSSSTKTASRLVP